MKPNWKAISRHPAYISLKKAVSRDLGGFGRNRSGRSKKEIYGLYRKIFSRLQHYSDRTGKPVQDILEEWEKERDGVWWFGFYSSHLSYRKGKIPSNKPSNIKPMGTKKLAARWYKPNSIAYRESIKKDKKLEAVNVRKKAGKKLRWSSERKKHNKRHRNL